MKIKTLRTYAQVELKKGQLESYFTAAKPGMKDLTMEYLPKLNMVEIKSPTVHVLVSAANIAFMVPEGAYNEATDGSLREPKQSETPPKYKTT